MQLSIALYKGPFLLLHWSSTRIYNSLPFKHTALRTVALSRYHPLNSIIDKFESVNLLKVIRTEHSSVTARYNKVNIPSVELFMRSLDIP